jgi:hypothetical protein
MTDGKETIVGRRITMIEDILIASFVGIIYGGVFLLMVSPLVGIVLGLIIAASLFLWLTFVTGETE